MENKFVREISQDALVTEKSDIFLNGLLGVYDNNGKYFISPKITEELIKVEKAKKYAFDNSIYCESNILGIGEIMFQIEYMKLPNGNSSAKLYILENVYKINGYLQNTIKTFLTEFEDTFDNFIEKTYNAFNVVVDYDENGRNKKVTLDTYMDYYLMSKKQYLVAVQADVEKKLDELYKRYFSKRVKILNSSNNPFANDVLKDFQNEYDKIENKFLQTSDYKTINELLDKCVEDVSGTKEEYLKYEAEFEVQTRPALKDFYNASNVLFDSAQTSALNNLYKKDKQRMSEVIITEKDFQTKSVAETKLSNVIDALSIDEYVGTESDYEENKTETLEDIIAQIKEKQREKAETGQNQEKQTIKAIIKPKFVKEVNDKIIANDKEKSSDNQSYSEEYSKNTDQQENEQDGDVIEHPQQGNVQNESEPLKNTTEQKAFIAKKSIKNIEKIIDEINAENVQNKMNLPTNQTFENENADEIIFQTDEQIKSNNEDVQIKPEPKSLKKPMPIIKKKHDLVMDSNDSKTSQELMDFNKQEERIPEIIKSDELPSGQNNRNGAYFTNGGEVLDVVSKDAYNYDKHIDYEIDMLKDKQTPRKKESSYEILQNKEVSYNSDFENMSAEDVSQQSAPQAIFEKPSVSFDQNNGLYNYKSNAHEFYEEKDKDFVPGDKELFKIEKVYEQQTPWQTETISQNEIQQTQDNIQVQNDQQFDINQSYQKTPKANLQDSVVDAKNNETTLDFDDVVGGFGGNSQSVQSQINAEVVEESVVDDNQEYIKSELVGTTMGVFSDLEADSEMNDRIVDDIISKDSRLLDNNIKEM